MPENKLSSFQSPSLLHSFWVSDKTVLVTGLKMAPASLGHIANGEA